MSLDQTTPTMKKDTIYPVDHDKYFKSLHLHTQVCLAWIKAIVLTIRNLLKIVTLLITIAQW